MARKVQVMTSCLLNFTVLNTVIFFFFYFYHCQSLTGPILEQIGLIRDQPRPPYVYVIHQIL